MTRQEFKNECALGYKEHAIETVLYPLGEKGVELPPLLRPDIIGIEDFQAQAVRFTTRLFARVKEGVWVCVKLKKGDGPYIDPDILSEFLLATDIFDD